jgi:hypothetical protein
VSPVRQAITTIGPLAPSASWLVPALVRWAHLRVYEVVIARAVPPELEDIVVVEAEGRSYPARPVCAPA